MGFNIGVSANTKDFKIEMECDKFLERTFYNWVVEFDLYGEYSCIIQTGKYFGLDLKPLTNLIYTNGEMDFEYIQSGMQNTDFLINLVDNLIKNVISDRNFIDKIENEPNKGASNEEMETKGITPGYDEFSKANNNIGKRWREYIIEGEFIEHLNILKESLVCFKSNGQDQVFLTAG